MKLTTFCKKCFDNVLKVLFIILIASMFLCKFTYPIRNQANEGKYAMDVWVMVFFLC